MELTIYQWRKVKNISQKELARRLGCHENSIRNWERHPEKLTPEKAVKIAEGLEVPVNNIVFCGMTLQNVEEKV